MTDQDLVSLSPPTTAGLIRPPRLACPALEDLSPITDTMPGITTSYSVLDWSADGVRITKVRLPAVDARRRFRNELRVNRLLNGHPPPVRRPVLLDFDVHQRSLTFSAVPGRVLGPKYPLQLASDAIDAIIDLSQRLGTFNVKRRWLRRFDSSRRLLLAQRVGLLTDKQTDSLLELAATVHARTRFGHGDLTARNVIDGPDGAVLIDWEWAGLYPASYELAFFWYSLIDVEGGRAHVMRHVGPDNRSFLLSALLIELWHLQWYLQADHLPKHLATRNELVAQLCG